MMAVEVVPDTRAGLLARRLLESLLCRVGRRGRLGHRRRRLEVARRGRLCACLGVLSGRSVWALSGRCLGVVLDVVRECALSGHGGAGGLSLVQE